jgi:hypothetical protein
MKKSIELCPPEVTGTVQGAVHPDLKALGADFGLRDLATKPLPLFIHMLPSIEMRATNAAKLFDGTWVDRILANAKRIWNERADKEDRIVEIAPAVSNVLHVKFGKK